MGARPGIDGCGRYPQSTGAIVFASSYSSKWDDYDPEGMEHWDKKE